MENYIKFNINRDISIQITEEGWDHIRKNKGQEYIKNCIEPYKKQIGRDIWYSLQAHHVFSLFPIEDGKIPNYNVNILIHKSDLIYGEK